MCTTQPNNFERLEIIRMMALYLQSTTDRARLFLDTPHFYGIAKKSFAFFFERLSWAPGGFCGMVVGFTGCQSFFSVPIIFFSSFLSGLGGAANSRMVLLIVRFASSRFFRRFVSVVILKTNGSLARATHGVVRRSSLSEFSNRLSNLASFTNSVSHVDTLLNFGMNVKQFNLLANEVQNA